MFSEAKLWPQAGQQRRGVDASRSQKKGSPAQLGEQEHKIRQILTACHLVLPYRALLIQQLITPKCSKCCSFLQHFRTMWTPKDFSALLKLYICECNTSALYLADVESPLRCLADIGQASPTLQGLHAKAPARVSDALLGFPHSHSWNKIHWVALSPVGSGF